jgi:SAM-dependent methyltransferase
MKIAICSIPGSEIHLLSRFLIELNFKDCHLYLCEDQFSEYSSFYLNTDKVHSDFYRNRFSFDEAIEKTKEDEFVVGHFGVNKKHFLGEFKTIFLYQNIKYSTISLGFLIKKLNLWKAEDISSKWRSEINNRDFIANFLKAHINAVYDLFNITVPWMNEEGVLKLNLDKLSGELGREIQILEFDKVVRYLGLHFSDKVLEAKISNALNKVNSNKNGVEKEYNFYHSKNFNHYYNKSGLKKLNKILGYENLKENIKNKFFFEKKLSFYDKYWKQNKKKISTWSYGINIVDDLMSNYDFKTVLDAGCGSGDVVRYLTSKGYDARGIELSKTVLEDFASDLLKKGIVQQGSLTQLPFRDNEFDVVFSSEVLEHINEEDIPQVVAELCRVSKEIIFLTISLRPSSNFNKYHVNLKPRLWWENQFLKYDVIKENEIIRKLQLIKPNATVKEIMEIGPTKTHIHEMDWFVNNPPYDLIGELEPWYFIFKKNV